MIFWFEELGQEHNNRVGKKCANLGQMTRMGLAVPPGFAISIAMYEKFVRETGVADEMASYAKGLGELKGSGISVFEEMSRTLRSMIESKEMPPSVREAIASYYTMLCNRTGAENVPVSVRSAGTESRPGMFETYLNVRGIEDVIEKVKRVWASAYTARAVAFRINKGLPVLGDELGVAIPKMVNARASGITFTVDPVTADGSKIILEANWGLGEGVVSGAESVDGFVVDKESMEIVARHVGNKVKCVVYTKDGADWADVPAHMQSTPCISDEEILEIAGVAKSAEKTLGGPQDMEWAVDQDLPFPQSLFWLQTRPAKVAAKKIASPASHIAELIAKKLGGV
ncbi:MAG: PEP/pyruvate-binding domain-containing protein [Thermodesulfobacteriota bacterium]